MSSILDSFEKEIEVIFSEEKYSVRDNGAVLRHPKIEGKNRKLDNVWTFGKINKQKGYLEFSGTAVHRIVATAFLGNPPDKSYVVDHIDTNRQNNRPENLRWVTRLENILLNDITRTKIEFICKCSIEDILKDISILQKVNLPPNFEWMKTHVSKEEAAMSLIRWKEWVANSKRRKDFDFNMMNYLKMSNNYKDDSVYPLEPKGINVSLKDYENNLAIGLSFYEKSYYIEKSFFVITDFCYNEKTDELYVATHNNSGIKSNYLTVVTRRKDTFIYDTRSFFDPNGIEKYMTIARGQEWTGGEVFDDYC